MIFARTGVERFLARSKGNVLPNAKNRSRRPQQSERGVNVMRCIDATTVKGYSLLTDENKAAFQRFIPEWLNRQGADDRERIKPERVYQAEEIACLGKARWDEEFYNSGDWVDLFRVLQAVYRDGTKEKIEQYSLPLNIPVIKQITTNYLRFEYRRGTRKNWLHIVDGGNSWY